MQNDLFGQQDIQLADADLSYVPDFLSVSEADALLAVLRGTLAWRQDSIRIYGREVKIPRLQAWYGDPEAQYRYSGLDMRPLPWTEELRELKMTCEQFTGSRFNAVLANYYRDGADGMGWHADDEPELGTSPVIASVSLGQRRNMDFRHRHNGEKYRIRLGHGSLLVMAGLTQQYWQHALPKSRKAMDDRINLTFRRIIHPTQR
ncbi:alpha-ketoglutarate-dependent dioxygenase AlkB family protein [Lacimicrobium alkaliphilum]|uniref:DNA repair protein n=1 Tax=Lacimicrobium alkaliphilum TaxID=1526571 RepID=A0A0U3B1S7_9ALTE|nr:alpha-ketoglutarate-dependent dioxygenase AlkB [Lacimicrobium alkaliphilum]ALS97481.1 DNA repair protein [Lacimicrobium alkaliphilum]